MHDPLGVPLLAQRSRSDFNSPQGLSFASFEVQTNNPPRISARGVIFFRLVLA